MVQGSLLSNTYQGMPVFRSEDYFNVVYWTNLYIGKRGGIGDSVDVIDIDIKKKDVDVEVQGMKEDVVVGKKGISVVLSKNEIEVVESGGDIDIDS